MTDELKQCAHCGHSVEFVYDKYAEINVDNPDPFGKIFCLGCGIQTGELMTLVEANTAWNSRREPDTLPSWAIDAINERLKRLEYDQLYHRISELEWVLALRKPEENK